MSHTRRSTGVTVYLGHIEWCLTTYWGFVSNPRLWLKMRVSRADYAGGRTFAEAGPEGERLVRPPV